jgi:ABC-type xylose transport system substrate-binding protein
MIAEIVSMDKEMVRQILHDKLNMRKVCAKMVPKNLTQGQKDNRKNICSNIMERITKQPDVLENVITCEET